MIAIKNPEIRSITYKVRFKEVILSFGIISKIAKNNVYVLDFINYRTAEYMKKRLIQLIKQKRL